MDSDPEVKARSNFSQSVNVLHSCTQQTGHSNYGFRLSASKAEKADEWPQGQAFLGDIYRHQYIKIFKHGCLKDGHFASSPSSPLSLTHP